MKKVSYILSLVMLLSFAFNVEAQTQEKKKWSPQAKGAVIGAGTGAAAGAVIHKRNRVAGAAVGAVGGAAVGYGVGKVVDNKQKKAAAEEAARIERERQMASNNSNVVYTSSTRNAGATTSRSYAAKPKAKTNSKAMVATQAEPEYLIVPNGWILNTGDTDPNVAYHNSEYRRKSW